MKSLERLLLAAFAAAAFAAPVASAPADVSPTPRNSDPAVATPMTDHSDGVTVDADGTVHIPPQTVPVSEFLSPEGKKYLATHLIEVQKPEMLVQHDGVPPLLAGYLERQRTLFAVNKEDTTIAGVHAYIYTPKAGIAAANTKRVLIDLHGGAFMGCWPTCGELESRPIAALGRIRVMSVDYREYPQYRFPAASEDVAAVYRELLKTYRPKDIGIYGCSAGGMLTGMSVAWFLKHGLPIPGAIGIFCAGMTVVPNGFGGDASYVAIPIGEARMPRVNAPSANSPNNATPNEPLPYFRGADLEDPLVSPVNSPALLAKYPPTLIITGTRGFELSSAVYTHTQLVKQGVDAHLFVWEGMFHGFFYNPDVPESRDCYKVIVDFFQKELGKR